MSQLPATAPGYGSRREVLTRGMERLRVADEARSAQLTEIWRAGIGEDHDRRRRVSAENGRRIPDARRAEIVTLVDRGMSSQEIANKYGIARNTVSQVYRAERAGARPVRLRVDRGR